jgi:hypothetical protein
MLAWFSRRRIVGSLIVVLSCTLCVTPMIGRGQADSSPELAAEGTVEGQTTYYASPSSRYDAPTENKFSRPAVELAVVPSRTGTNEAPAAREPAPDTPVVSPARPGMVTIDDILAMTRSGVPAEVIVPHIEARGIAQAVNSADILRMQECGVAASVLSAAQRVATKLGTPEHIAASKSFFLVKTTYRLASTSAESLGQLLREQVGRPEVFEVTLDTPDTLTIIASPRAQSAISELVALIREAETDSKKPAPEKAVEKKAIEAHVP